LVDAEVGLPRQNAKVRIVGAVPDGTFHVANRAVALNGRANTTVNLESDAPTVTRALVRLHAGILECGLTLELSGGEAVRLERDVRAPARRSSHPI